MGIFSRSKAGARRHTPTHEEKVHEFVRAWKKGDAKWLGRLLPWSYGGSTSS